MAQKRNPHPTRPPARPAASAASRVTEAPTALPDLPPWMAHPWFGYAGMIGVLLLMIWIRVQHFEMPLERDEGEFGYIAQEMLRGNWPYVTAFTQKLPGAYLVYMLFVGLFGATDTAIHLGLLLTNMAVAWLLFVVGRKLFDPLAGIVAAFCWTIMASGPNLMGFAGHATFFIALFATLGLLLLLQADEKPKLWRFLVAGLAFGVAFLMKQPAVFFTPFAIGWLLVDSVVQKRFPLPEFLKRAFALGVGSLIPYILCLIVFAAGGHFDAFWFWTFAFAREFVGQITGEMAIQNFKFNFNIVTQGFVIPWVLAGAGLVASFFYAREPRQKHLLPLLALASFLTVVPGYYFTTHYFIALLPALTLLIGFLCHAVMSLGRKYLKQPLVVLVPVLLVGVATLTALREFKLYYFYDSEAMSHSELAHAVYGSNPFPEAKAIGDYIAQNSKPEDEVIVLGSEPQIYFYSGRRSATPSVVTYYMTANHSRNLQMQQDMVRDVETRKPRYLVFVSVGTSWMFRPDSPNYITDWFNENNSKDYAPVGLAEIIKTPDGMYQSTIYKWGAEFATHQRTSSDFIVLFERIPGH